MNMNNIDMSIYFEQDRMIYTTDELIDVCEQLENKKKEQKSTYNFLKMVEKISELYDVSNDEAILMTQGAINLFEFDKYLEQSYLDKCIYSPYIPMTIINKAGE